MKLRIVVTALKTRSREPSGRARWRGEPGRAREGGVGEEGGVRLQFAFPDANHCVPFSPAGGLGPRRAGL